MAVPPAAPTQSAVLSRSLRQVTVWLCGPVSRWMAQWPTHPPTRPYTHLPHTHTPRRLQDERTSLDGEARELVEYAARLQAQSAELAARSAEAEARHAELSAALETLTLDQVCECGCGRKGLRPRANRPVQARLLYAPGVLRVMWWLWLEICIVLPVSSDVVGSVAPPPPPHSGVFGCRLLQASVKAGHLQLEDHKRVLAETKKVRSRPGWPAGWPDDQLAVSHRTRLALLHPGSCF